MKDQTQKPAILWAVDPYQTDSKPDADGSEESKSRDCRFAEKPRDGCRIKQRS
jgi:hypothetical protein